MTRPRGQAAGHVRIARLAQAATLALAEAGRAVSIYPPFNSPHEGWAVIFEELDELWDHVRANTGRTEDAAQEAVQVAAMALRYIAELGPR